MMDRVFAIADQPIDSSLFAVVVIGQPARGQRHIGILHRTADTGPALLHLAWHCRLCNELKIPDYMLLWASPNVRPERLRSVAAFCRRVWRKNESGGIPYAFSDPIASLDPVTGEFLCGPTRFGLTCASFVLAVFHVTGLQLVEYDTWETDRPGDREWQEMIIASLDGKSSLEHVKHLRSEIGAVRYRPEEVAAAASLALPPVPFAPAATLGQHIVTRMERMVNDSPEEASTQSSE